MKVYVVFRSDGEGSEAEMGFLDEQEARAYVLHKNLTTNDSWHHEELGVVE